MFWTFTKTTFFQITTNTAFTILTDSTCTSKTTFYITQQIWAKIQSKSTWNALNSLGLRTVIYPDVRNFQTLKVQVPTKATDHNYRKQEIRKNYRKYFRRFLLAVTTTGKVEPCRVQFLKEVHRVWQKNVKGHLLEGTTFITETKNLQ